MLRRRLMFVDSTPGPPDPPPDPPVPTESYIYLEVACDDGSLTFNNKKGISYKKLTTNLSNAAEVTTASNSNLKLNFNKKNLNAGETVLKVKAYVDTYSPDIDLFVSAELGANTWNDSTLIIDFANFDAANLKGINFIFNRSGMSNLKRFEFKNLNAPGLIDMHNKKAGGFWELGIFNNVFGYDADVFFINCKTPNLKTIKGMFQGAGVKTADLSGLDTTALTDIERLFDNCYNITSFKVMTPMNNVTVTTDAFTYCNTAATFFYNKNYDYSKIPIPKGWTKTPV